MQNDTTITVNHLLVVFLLIVMSITFLVGCGPMEHSTIAVSQEVALLDKVELEQTSDDTYRLVYTFKDGRVRHINNVQRLVCGAR